MSEKIKRRIVFIMKTNSFLYNMMSGITFGLWARFYAENLSLTWTQAQSTILVFTMFIMGHLTQSRATRKWIFNHFPISVCVSVIIDLVSIIVFSINNDARLLLIGDTLSAIMVCTNDSVFTEIYSAIFSGNERGDVSAQRLKWATGGHLISMVGSMLIAILVIGDNKVPTDVLLISQIFMWVVSVYTTTQLCVKWKLSRTSVYRMWRDK